MPAEIVTSAFCAHYWSVFEVEGSTGDTYRVIWNGAETPVQCWNVTQDAQCKGMQFHGTCSHVTKTFREGCFWNPQWYEGGTRKLKPVLKPDRTRTTGQKCPKCRGPMIPVRIAV